MSLSNFIRIYLTLKKNEEFNISIQVNLLILMSKTILLSYSEKYFFNQIYDQNSSIFYDFAPYVYVFITL